MDWRGCYCNRTVRPDYEGAGPVLSSEESGDVTLHRLEQDKPYKRDNLISVDYISILFMPCLRDDCDGRKRDLPKSSIEG